MKKKLLCATSVLLLGIMLAACDSAAPTGGHSVLDGEDITESISVSSGDSSEASIDESKAGSDENTGESQEVSGESSESSQVASAESGESQQAASGESKEESQSSSSESKMTQKDTEASKTASQTVSSEETKESKNEEQTVVNTKPVRNGTYYKSELTGELVDTALQNYRPVAIMVDNEILTYPHYGINQADIVYEMMNSTANGRITRFMCIVKDYDMITRFGGVRSIRPTNFLVGFPYEAIFCHDGGPYYINDYLAKRYCSHLSGIFARYTRPASERPSWATSYQGKSYASEFTEFVTYENYKNPNTGKSYNGLKTALSKANFSTEYSSSYKGSGFHFTDSETDLTNFSTSSSATEVSLPYPHTSTGVKYNSSTKTYDLYEYGNLHTDAADGNNATTFKNVLLLRTSFSQLDEHGYMVYNYYNYVENMQDRADGFYLTNGHVIPIKWSKSADDSEHAHYYVAETGEELQLNVGKIYINLVPSDNWYSVAIK